ncbi:MAG: hypothetical protein JW912_00465 [Sedimentisphaerales bacterium]|nr:hypothetical protein [Sedimentisphaerales bacterium]
MDYIIIILQLVLSIVVLLVWMWIKELPTSFHKLHQQTFQHELNQKLESFKTTLSRELEVFRISHAELQIRKTEEFISFGNLQREFLTDKELLKKLEAGESETVNEINKKILNLATGLFFFASDQTVKKYGDWKTRSGKGELAGIEIVRQFGQLMVALRKDLGHADTALNEDDYLNLFVTDWYKHQNEI